VKVADFITRTSISIYLNAGNILIINVNNEGHWVLATMMINSGTVAVNYPGYSTTSNTFDQILDANCGVYHVWQ
jgi:hypothetical protein